MVALNTPEGRVWERVAFNLCAEFGSDYTADKQDFARAVVREYLAASSAYASTSAGVTEEQVEALRPFAQYGKLVSRRDDALELSIYSTLNGKPEGVELTVGDFRRATAALEASRVAPVSQKEAVAKYPLATFGHADVLPLGIYRIHWKSGGSSLAAVGMMENGDRWLAPTNWTAPNMDPTNEWSWGDIERAEPIPSPAPAIEPVGIKALDTCQTCQGNGEIVTDWDTYLHGDDDEHATAECPDCNGIGKVSPTQVSAPVGVVEELAAALEPFVSHYEPWMDDWADEATSSSYSRHTFGQLRRARALLDRLRSPAVEGK